MAQNYKEAAEKLLPHLKQRNFEAYYCENAESAAEKALELIDKDGTVAWGGSRTVAQLGLIEKLRDAGVKLIDRDTAETPEERNELMLQGLCADTFLMSTNAISADGILVNIDGLGNRVAAMCFGPKSVIVLVGMNKLCDTVEEAEERVHAIAAPLNAKRFGLTKTGCSVGKCVDCLSDECMCSYVVKTRRCKIPGRIKIILIGEDLGF